jgi:hypothetical protein
MFDQNAIKSLESYFGKTIKQLHPDVLIDVNIREVKHLIVGNLEYSIEYIVNDDIIYILKVSML